MKNSLSDNKVRSILFLSHYFWPEAMATADMLSGIAFSLSNSKTTVSCLAGHPAYHGSRERLPAVLEHHGVKVKRVWSTQLDKNRTLGRVLNTATFTASSLLSCLFGKRPDMLLAVTNPPLLPWVAWAVNMLRGVPYILIIHDVYPDVAVALDRLSKGSFVDRTWRFLNRISYRKAVRIIALGDCMADILRSQLPPEQHHKVVIIPNWADGKEIQPIERKYHVLLKEWGLEDKFVIQYSGNIGLFHDIETIVDAADLLKDHDNIHFLFIGEGGQLSWLQEQVRERRLPNVTILPFQSKSRLPLTLTACDVSLVTLKDEVTGYCVPSKFYGILAAGKPVLCVANPSSEPALKVRLYDCGLTVDPGDSQGLAKAICFMKDGQETCQRFGKAARMAFDKHYSLEKISALYRGLLKEVLK